jgi:hypothetical protein
VNGGQGLLIFFLFLLTALPEKESPENSTLGERKRNKISSSLA